jgi:hypothetical protein
VKDLNGDFMYFYENITTKTLHLKINYVDISHIFYLLKSNGLHDGTIEHYPSGYIHLR